MLVMIVLDNSLCILSHKQDRKKAVQDSMNNLRSATLLFRWDKKSLPPHLHRLDAPWIHLLKIQIQRDQDLQNWIQKQWDDSRDRFYRSRGLKPPKRKKTVSQAIGGTFEENTNEDSHKKKGSKSKNDEKNPDKPPQVANEDMRFVAKMVSRTD